MQKIYSVPESLRNVKTHYCPGCGHGIIHRIICEVIDEFRIREKTIGVASVGCSVIAYNYWNFDVSEAAHGRAPAVATGIKRIHPEKIVFTYQGDGDLASIGTAEIIHTANRGENISVVFVNNAVYGMTGGQMAPTTIEKQVTKTTPLGRDFKLHGFPFRITEMLSVLEPVVYLERCSVHSPTNINKTKKAIKKSFRMQLENKGFSLIEIISPCPTYWKVKPTEASYWIENNMLKYYPLGVIKDAP